MKVFTIGYGGRTPTELLTLLKKYNVHTIVDVRSRPDRASMGSFVKAKTPDKGIEKLLASEGINYISLIELGNIFSMYEEWGKRYEQLLKTSGDLLTERLWSIQQPFCLMCAEKFVHECHRKQIADYLVSKGHEVEHL